MSDADYQREFYDRHFATRRPVLAEQLAHPLFSEFNRRLAVRLLAHAPAVEPVRVLEVGCGEGLLAAGFMELAPAVEYTGSDISAAAIELATEAVPGARFLVGDREAPAGSADLVVAKNLVHHLDDPVSFFESARRALGSGGRLAVVEPMRTSAQAWVFNVLEPRREKYFFLRGRRQLRTSLADAGLRVVAEEGFSFLPYELAFAVRFSTPRRLLRARPDRVARVDDALARVLPWVAAYQVFVAEPV